MDRHGSLPHAHSIILPECGRVVANGPLLESQANRQTRYLQSPIQRIIVLLDLDLILYLTDIIIMCQFTVCFD